VAKVDPATGTELNNYNNVGFAVAGAGITTGPDGNLWTVSGDKLISFSPANPDGTDADTVITGMQGKGMATGSDGLLWIADGSGFVHSATAAPLPSVTTYALGGGAQDVAAGPSAQVAYANPLTNPQTVGRITPGGTPLVTDLEASDPFGVAFGQDGAYWIARANTNDLLRLTPEGATSALSGFAPSGGVGPRKVATGPNGTLWVTLDTPEAIGRVSGVEPPVPPPTAVETTIDKAPKKKVKTKKAKAKVKFKFSSPTAGASFECSLKGKPKGGKRKKGMFKPCESPKKYKLKPGKYTFEVRASVGGVVDQTPAKHKFKVVAV
jgi:streptogramin lyase